MVKRGVAPAEGDNEHDPVEGAPPATSSPPSDERPQEVVLLEGVIHDTTNALTVVMGWIARARALSESEAVQVALDHAAGHADQVRLTMRRAIGAQLPPPADEAVADLVGRLRDDLAEEARRSAARISGVVSRAARSAFAKAPGTAWQILTNLLLNALAASPADGEVVLEADIVDGALWFTVQDEGPGIPAARRPTLFHDGISARPGGAGIGLRHAHALAAGAGGALVLEDTPEGKGARFALRWPHISMPEAVPSSRAVLSSPRPSRARVLSGLQILLVEDDDAVIELLEIALTNRGASLTVARDRRELDSILTQRNFDVMLMDLSPFGDPAVSTDPNEIPEALGSTLSRARKDNPDVRVMVISRSVAVSPRADVTWMRKPFDTSELVEAISNLKADVVGPNGA
ncbi:MAG: ATP-binding protein [Myxococcota bacterium]